MKTSYLFFILVACIYLTACSKKSDLVRKGSNPAAFDYEIDSIKNITVGQNDRALAIWDVRLLSGASDNVKLIVSGLPADVKATPNIVEGIPPYTTTIAFSATRAASLGSYPLTITSISAATTKTYTFNIDVTLVSDCSSDFTGEYTGCSACDSPTLFITYTGKPDKVVIHDFLYFGDVNATVNCTNNTLIISQEIPISTYESIYLTGTGRFVENNLVINYEFTYAGYNGGQVTLTRK